ncbi:serine acetyltransferase [Pseudoprevotella muciniphila]|uniref:Serine acetyltransferase n=1 Tax=Pseudoprevotella muciniphila TaxID=2133944 RepID=A0A5P8E941_9BACT|nr:serine acetyltransferase [Pseudoprevotella muciniphila]QFQ13417.1 serine acetyltransferase [Pseudoprevotella muciniphila]
MKLFSLIKSLRLIPHILVFYTRNKKDKSLLIYERDIWLKLNRFEKKGLRGFLFLLNIFPEYRSLFYYRTKASYLRHFAKGQTNLYFHTPSELIGRGLMIWHGYGTVINAQSIGEDCQIWQLCTIGKKNTEPVENRPIVGNNVKICTNSLIIGNIKVDDNCTIAGGAVVLKDIPKNAIVAGNPAVIKKCVL